MGDAEGVEERGEPVAGFEERLGRDEVVEELWGDVCVGGVDCGLVVGLVVVVGIVGGGSGSTNV